MRLVSASLAALLGILVAPLAAVPQTTENPALTITRVTASYAPESGMRCPVTFVVDYTVAPNSTTAALRATGAGFNLTFPNQKPTLLPALPTTSGESPLHYDAPGNFNGNITLTPNLSSGKAFTVPVTITCPQVAAVTPSPAPTSQATPSQPITGVSATISAATVNTGTLQPVSGVNCPVRFAVTYTVTPGTSAEYMRASGAGFVLGIPNQTTTTLHALPTPEHQLTLVYDAPGDFKGTVTITPNVSGAKAFSMPLTVTCPKIVTTPGQISSP